MLASTAVASLAANLTEAEAYHLLAKCRGTNANELSGLESLNADAVVEAFVGREDTSLLRHLVSVDGVTITDDQSHRGSTALHVAAFQGDVECGTLLLRAGARPDTPDHIGLTPLHWAILKGHASLAHELAVSIAASPALVAARTPDARLTPLMLACATGDARVVAALLEGAGNTSDASDAHASADGLGAGNASDASDASDAHASADGLTAAGLARAMGHTHLSHMLAGSSELPPAEGPHFFGAEEATLDDLAAQPAAWAAAFTTSAPLVVRGLGAEWAARLAGWERRDFVRRWGEQSVHVVFSPDDQYQGHQAQHEPHEQDAQHQVRPPPSVVRDPPAETMSFAEFAALLPHVDAGGGAARTEHVAVQQSEAEALEAFGGLPSLTDLRAKLRNVTTEPFLAAASVRQNLWVSAPPTLSRLHFDSDDSLLVQLAGSKRVALLDPAPMHGLTAHPVVAPVVSLHRDAPGEYRWRRADGSAAGGGDVRGEGEEQQYFANFPLLSVRRPDAARHPLVRHAHIVSAELREGDALLLPAYWYHEVESTAAEPSALNVAINLWFETSSRVSLLHSVMRDPADGLHVRHGSI